MPAHLSQPAPLDGEPGLAFEATKRTMDVLLSLAALAWALPVMALCAAWVKLLDGGPVLYRQWRVGRDGWLFEVYKLRTMRQDAEAGGVRFAEAGDARVLPGCGWMRRSHVDELPQIFNVLRGEMSLVGPRPERPEVIERLRVDLPQFENRLAATPGITGLAQVRNGYSNDAHGMKRKLAYDLEYLRGRSVLGDVRLLLATVPKLWDRGAC